MSRMKPGQKGIFYIAADSLAAAAGAPFVERLVQKGYEVLYLTEPIDEPALNAVGQFSGHDFVDVTREGLELGDGEEEKREGRFDRRQQAPLIFFLLFFSLSLSPQRKRTTPASYLPRSFLSFFNCRTVKFGFKNWVPLFAR